MKLAGMWRGMTIQTNTEFAMALGGFRKQNILIMEKHKSSQQKFSISIYNQSQSQTAQENAKEKPNTAKLNFNNTQRTIR